MPPKKAAPKGASAKASTAAKSTNTKTSPPASSKPSKDEPSDEMRVKNAVDAETSTKPKPTSKPKSTSKSNSAQTQDQDNGQKRKKPTNDNGDGNDDSAKTARRSNRTTSTRKSSYPPPAATLNYLLSAACTDLLRPAAEREHIDSNNGSATEYRSYTTTVPLTPFEELLSACILSRPISHALGQRSIRTVLNPPWSFNTARAVRDAGDEKRHQALEAARTQHKAKTAQQMGGLADVVLEKFSGDGDGEGVYLQGLKEADDGSADRIRQVLTKSVKGMGKTGCDIFLRRVQGYWDEVYPFVDAKSASCLQGLGLPGDGEGLRDVMEECWGSLDVSGVAGRGRKESKEKKMMAFVLVVERAVGGELEGKTGEILEKVRGSKSGGDGGGIMKAQS